jgi:periplasmic divalent cation tolerance protein
MTTCPDRRSAARLAGSLVDARLAACVQLLPIESHYAWKGKRTRSREVLLLAKTRAARFAAVRDHIEEHHPYEIPEIVAVPASAGSAAYIAWVLGQTR